jgi:hypothetical protein
MLGPDSRQTLVDLVVPPMGYRLDAAVGATFSLDLDAYLMVPAAVTLATTTNANDQDESSPPRLEMLDALRRVAGRITIFCQAGQIAVPQSSRRSLYAFLESGTVMVHAPRGGVFHPKTWALRFGAEHGGYIHRLLILSRNLTFDRSWDCVVRLDEDASGARLAGLRDYIEGLPSLAKFITSGHKARVLDVAATIDLARFSVPPGFDTMRLHAMGLDEANASRPLPREMDRALVVSPFLKRRLIEGLPVAWDRLAVVSRSDHLDAELSAADGCAAYEINPDLIDDTTDSTPAVQDEADGAKSTLQGLHAKLFVIDNGGRSHVFAGSANATSAAFENNVEVLLEMSGARAHVGVARWLADPVLGDASARRTFRQLLITHEWAPVDDDLEALEDELGDALDQLRRSVAEVPMRVLVGDEGQGLFPVRFLSEGPLPSLGGAILRVRPITVAGWSDQKGGLPLDLQLDLTFAALTAFLACELSLDGSKTAFVLVAQMNGEPVNRQARLVALLLGDADRLVRYLLMLLRDDDSLRLTGNDTQNWTWSNQTTHLETVPLMEIMVRALARSPDRLRDVRVLLDELKTLPAVIPASLRQLWETICKAADRRA